MSAKPNYFKLGLFILIALFLLFAAIILFGSGIFGQENIYFETYFKDSVSGLSVGAPVQDNGVQIGTVEGISFIRHDYTLPEGPDGFSKYRPYVRVVCSVRSENLPEMSEAERQEGLDLLVKNGLRLRLSTNILTGQGFIEAEYVDPERYPVETFPWKTEHPYLPSAPSTFTTLKDSVDKILHRLEQIDTEKIADNINTLLETTDAAIKDMNIAEIRTKSSRLLDTVNQAVEDAQVAELSDQMNTVIDRIDRLVQTQSPKVIELLETFRQMADNLNRLTENLEENPSDLIFSQPPEK